MSVLHLLPVLRLALCHGIGVVPLHGGNLGAILLHLLGDDLGLFPALLQIVPKGGGGVPVVLAIGVPLGRYLADGCLEFDDLGLVGGLFILEDGHVCPQAVRFGLGIVLGLL